MVEMKIPKEIRSYKENFFFGLNMRQCFFSVLALGAAVGVHILLQPLELGVDIRSWICILAACPFAFLAFFRYNGMSAEKFVIVWVRSQLLMPRQLLFKPTNIYMEIVADTVEKNLKEEIPFYAD